MKELALTALALICALVSSADAHQKLHGRLKIVHPYTFETAASEAEAAVMMTISISGGRADTLIGASTSIAELAVVVSGNPDQPNTITVPEDAKVELKEKGSHISLKALRKTLTAYDSFPLQLIFEKTGAVGDRSPRRGALVDYASGVAAV